MRRRKQIDPIPEEFASYEEAAEFWDTHNTTDYPDAFRTVEVTSELRRRHYEIEIDADVIRKLRRQARRGFPALAQHGRVRRYRHRVGHGAAHHPPTRWPSLGRGSDREGCHLLLYP